MFKIKEWWSLKTVKTPNIIIDRKDNPRSSVTWLSPTPSKPPLLKSVAAPAIVRHPDINDEKAIATLQT